MKTTIKLLTILLMITTSYAEEVLDAAAVEARQELNEICQGVVQNVSYYKDNLADGSLMSLAVEIEPGVTKYDVLIKVNHEDGSDYVSCHQNFALPLLDQSLEELETMAVTEGQSNLACVEAGSGVSPGNAISGDLANLQAVAEGAMCEANEESSLKSCAANMAYCGLDNLNLAGVVGIEKPPGVECTGVVEGAANTVLNIGQCMATFLRGIYNEITDTLKFLVVEAPVWLYENTFGRWFGEPAVEQMENVESLEAIASSEASDEEIAEEEENPEQSFVDKILAFTNQLILEQGVKNFGCATWSSGIPGVGECLEAPASWECATCKQKAMAICGVAGYATGIVVETAVLATPVGVVAGTALALAKNAGRASKAAKVAKATKEGSRLAAATVRGAQAVGRGAMTIIRPLAKGGYMLGKGALKGIKAIPGAVVTAKVASAPIRYLLKADDFLTSKAWSYSYHGSRAYTQSLAKTGNVSLALNAARTAARVNQVQKIGLNLVQTQSQVRKAAEEAADQSLSAAARAEASRRQARLTAQMRRQEGRYTAARDAIKVEELESAHHLGSPHADGIINTFKAQDQQITADLYKYGLDHVQKMETLMPPDDLVFRFTRGEGRLELAGFQGPSRNYLETLQRVGDELQIRDPDALREFAYLPSDKLHQFAEKYPGYGDPMDVLTNIYREKYGEQLKLVPDPVDRDNVVKLIRELELRQNNPSQITTKLDEVLRSCRL